MKRMTLIALCLMVTGAIFADIWETDYKSVEAAITEPTFADKEYVITKYGASTDATAAKNQKAINKAIEKCSKGGGGRVVVPEGTFLTGAITLLSNVNLVVSEGATLLFAFEPELYPIVRTRWEGLDCWNLQPCIYAYEQENIAITGKGTIDGGGNKETWWPWCGSASYGWQQGMISQSNGARASLLKYAEDGVPMDERRYGPEDGLRPQLINPYKCNNVLIEDVTLLDSPFWVIHPLMCKSVTVRGVHINNDGPNGDGCDPESCDGVLIENCYFNTGDDCIAIKSGRNNDGRLWDMPSQNIIIRNCEMKNGHGGVVIGSEISGGCRNVFAENNIMDSPSLERVVRIKTNTCRGGVIENIYARNITVGQCAESILKINLDYEHNEICCRGFLPTVRNVRIENITCEKSKYGVQIIALDTCTNVYDIYVKDCKFNGVTEGNTIKGMTRNIVFDSLFVNGGLSLIEKPYEHYSEWMTASEMKRTPESYMLDFSKRPKWSYVMGIELESMLDTYLRYGGEEIKDYCKLYTDTMINASGEIRGYRLEDYNLDQIRTGHFVTRMYELFPEAKNLTAMRTLMTQLKDQPRTDEGVFWHKAIYSYQVWLDGIFMGLPYYTLTATLLKEKGLMKAAEAKVIYDDAVDQISKTYERTLDTKTGLNRHAWDETHEMFWADKETGLSQHCWGRAQGWYTMALIELLDALPEDYERRSEVIELLRKDLDAVIKWQDKKSGVWYQVMDSPTREGNYLEATCSSMFTYVLLKAYRKGYLGSKYRDAGIKAYRGIVNNFIKVESDSTISLTNCCAVAGLGPGLSDKVQAAVEKYGMTLKPNTRRDGSYEYYLSENIRDNDAKGIGPFIWASLEMEALGYTTTSIDNPINRQAVVTRNNPVVTEANNLASLTVGNGHFATTVDVTGLQSYPFDYEAGVPLNAMSDWGWHSFPNTEGLTEEETMDTFNFGRGRSETYCVEYKNGGRNQMATEYYRANPHRLSLGTIGLAFKDAQGNDVPLAAIKDIHQELALWDGVIQSEYSIDGVPVEVKTSCAQDADALFARVKTTLLAEGRAAVTIKFAYPTGKHADDANDWTSPDAHTSTIIDSTASSAVIERKVDETTYYVFLQWEGNAELTETDKHVFTLSTKDDVLSFRAEYKAASSDYKARKETVYTFDKALKAVMKVWPRFWNAGGFVDFSGCTDPRAAELERRVILSQYLTQVNCANSMPPQETGLTYNTWYGRPHLEMTWWHAVDFALWGRPETVTTMMDWYNDVAFPKAKTIAKNQGFAGIRWMKMTDPDAGYTPSNVGSFLTWQQPHYIYMAEELYRAKPSKETLKKYGEGVEQTAAFMADYAKACSPTGEIYLQQTAMQESMSKDYSYSQPFEQAYWVYGLTTANEWRVRQGLERNADWDEIVSLMAPLASENGIYLSGVRKGGTSTDNNKDDISAGSSAEKNFDPFDTGEQISVKPISDSLYALKSRSDHPAVLGACGMLPYSGLYNPEVMRATLNYVMENWNWPTTWGWDYGMIALCAARLGEPTVALDALLIEQGKNTYLVSGHNFQEPKRLRLYLPGNGALLDAVAMMCAGWDGCESVNNPGFPADGTWNVRWEGLNRMQ